MPPWSGTLGPAAGRSLRVKEPPRRVASRRPYRPEGSSGLCLLLCHLTKPSRRSCQRGPQPHFGGSTRQPCWGALGCLPHTSPLSICSLPGPWASHVPQCFESPGHLEHTGFHTPLKAVNNFHQIKLCMETEDIEGTVSQYLVRVPKGSTEHLGDPQTGYSPPSHLTDGETEA